MRNRLRAHNGCAVTMKSGVASIEDPFAVLGLARSFSLDSERIVSAQVRALARSHPDRQAQGVERELAIAQSARINGAAAILRNSVMRAEALIALHDGGGASVALSATQLMELLERREAIEQIDEDAHRRRAELCAWIDSECVAAFTSLEAMEKSGQIDWTKARFAVAYMRALRRLSDEIDRMSDAPRLDGTR